MSNDSLYGSKEYYEDVFGDIFSDISDDDVEIENLFEGLMASIDAWLDYHKAATCRYEQLRKRIYKALTVS